MATRYGDASENPNYNDNIQFEQPERRRMTKLYEVPPNHQFQFKKFTPESLVNIQRRKSSRAKRHSAAYLDPARPKPEPEPYLASGQQLPPALVRQLPEELVGKPIEDVDPYYADQETFVIISRGKELTRFSAKKALHIFGPFHPIRRVVLYILVSSIFNLFVILTILTNCILMTIQGSELVEKTELIFTIIYTTEMGLKVLARGFILDQFTYLRDPWNWLDFAVIIMAYLTIVVEDLGNLSVMRTFRVLRALKTVAIIPGMKTIVGAVIDSVKNLKDVVVLTLFSLSVFSLLGLQIYMGLLTQKCIRNGPNNMTDSEWFNWCNNSERWIPEYDEEIYGAFRLCGNATGAQSCPAGFTCLQGFGPNPDYGFTNFDTFGWALICSFRLMTQDFWEGLYMQILKTAGSWHIMFFIVSIFLGSIYLMNLILAIVAMSYNELQRRAEEEEEAAAEDEAAFLESCRLMELQDQASQFSRSTPEVGTSYRPSVEIGLVGQSLLASLCRNGLLGQQVCERLEQQMMLPGFNDTFNNDGGGGGGGSGNGGPGALKSGGAIRSHSLSVYLDRRQSQAGQWTPGMSTPHGHNQAGSRYNAQYGRQHHHPNSHLNPQHDPFTMATSMTELRRKSSVRTNGSTSPLSQNNESLLGQRRLLPNIGVSGNRLDRKGSRVYQQGRLGHQHCVSSGTLMLRKDSEYGSDGRPSGSMRPYRARSSTTSDKDLQVLKQRAAMIRIVSDDSSEPKSEVGSQADGLKHSSRTAAKQASEMSVFSSGRSGSSAYADLATTGTGGGPGVIAGGGVKMQHVLSSVDVQAPITSRGSVRLAPSQPFSQTDLDSFVSEEVVASCLRKQSSTLPPSTSTITTPAIGPSSSPTICEQPTSAFPFGRPSVAGVAAQTTSNRLSPSYRRRSSARQGRRCSTLSNVETSTATAILTTPTRNVGGRCTQPNELSTRRGSRHHKTLSQQHLVAASSGGGGGGGGQQLQALASTSSGSGGGSGDRAGAPSLDRSVIVQQDRIGGSMRTLVSAAATASSPTKTTLSSVSRAPRRLGVESYLQSDRMHHLSVENFQQFGAIRPIAPTNSQATQQQTATHDALTFAKSLPCGQQPPLPVDCSMATAIGSMGGEGGAGGGSSSTTTELPFRRASLRQRGRYESRGNIHPSTMVRSSFSRPCQSFVADSGPLVPDGGGPIRRMSREFTRRASDWSRLSMSTNVDLRRLLRLWSHTNPYQGRPSISSNYSQTNQSMRATAADPLGAGGGYESPGGNSAKCAAAAACGQYSTQNSPRPSSVGSAWQAYEIISAINRRNNRYQSDARFYAGASMPLDDNLTEKMSISMRDKGIAYCLSCLDILCIWECCGAWLKVQRIIALVVFDPFTELFIIFCILINTLFMALDSDDADAQMRSIFERGNYFFTATFAVEASMKIMALSPKFYFREGWNVFDSIIVGLSLLELGLQGVYGLSVLRTFRLLRVFKLAKSWPTLNLLISIMGKAVGDLGNLTFVLAIIVFIFAVMGMQLFGTKYVANNFPSRELPRWNFTDFMHSFMIVFRILCAEWIEPMWDCLLVGGWPCVPFFLIAVTVGNLVVLNLFLALLLASFGASNLSSPQADNVDTKKLQEAIARFSRFGRWTRKCAARLLHNLTAFVLRNKTDGNASKSGLGGGTFGEACEHYNTEFMRHGSGGTPTGGSHIAAMSRMERLQNIERRTEELKSKIRRSPEHHYHLRQLARSQMRASGGGNAGGGYNYDYVTRTTAGNREQTQHVSMIPIIVNEVEPAAIEEDQEVAATGSGATNVARQCPQEACSLECEPRDSSSLSSLSSADVPLRPCDFNRSPPSTDSLPAPEKPAGNRHTVFANSMQPIREDSKDGSNSSGSLNHTNPNRKEFAAPPLVKDGSERPSPTNNDDGGGVCDEGLASLAHRPLLYGYSTISGGEQCNNNSTSSIGRSVGATKRKCHGEDRPQESSHRQHQSHQETTYVATTAAVGSPLEEEEAGGGDDEDGLEQRPKSSLYLKAPKREEMEEEDERTLQHIESYIEKCICIGIICLKWFLFRQYVRRIVEHKYFDQCILILIVISSGTLALEDKHLNERPVLKRTLDVLDTIFTIIFSLEMILKWLAFGLRRYFGNIWSWLDFLIVLVSFVNLMASIFGSGKIQALKTMRTLRAMRGLRPLRALQRFQGMRVVVNALIQAIPSIFNVLLVCLIFWLIFSIMGVQMFGGKFSRCIIKETGRVVTYEEAANRFECLERNLTWSNPQINFDNVLNAYLALFQVATFKGWIDIMNSATDSRNRDDQPIREANIYMYFYFVFFVIFGSFFTLNLFIGVIIDNFNEQKKKTGGSLEIFMTEDQKKYYHAMKKMRSKKPVKAMTRPKFKLQAYMFDITTSKKFDLAIMLIIGLNMFVMALEHYGQSQEFSMVLENLNLIFIAIFTLECLCKIFAMRHFYFREPWNIFDFIVVDLSILGVIMKEYVAKYLVSPTLLRVVRVVKVGRVLRLVKGAKGIRTLLFALAMSLPALFNICLLLFLVMFIYAIFGMSFFMNVRKRAGIDETFNFETFSSSIIVLFQMSTSAGWDLVLDPLMDEENDCVKPDPALGLEGTCGNKGIAIAYLISYVIVTFLIIINMYIAVILENYSQATEDVQEGLTDDDYEMYYEIWQKFDPDGTQYLPYERLSDFVDALEDPLRIPKPNGLALVILDINIYEGNQCYCVDILDALTKYFFTRKGLVIQVNEHLQKVQSTLHEVSVCEDAI